MSKKLTCKMFGGLNSEAQNALMSAFFEAAGGEDNLYTYLEETAKSSLVVEIHAHLRLLGYEIKKI